MHRSVSRRDTLRTFGAWVVFVGGAGSVAALTQSCGPTPSSAQPSGTAGCGCNATPTGTNSGLNRSAIPLNGVAYNASAELFVCHDANGFYCLDALCTHAGCDMGQQGGFNTANLGSGFFCNCHGSSFDANGGVTGGPAPTGLPHYQLAFDSSGDAWIDYHKKVSADCRCT